MVTKKKTQKFEKKMDQKRHIETTISEILLTHIALCIITKL